MEKLLKFTARNHITDRWLKENPEVMIECWFCGALIQKDDPRRKYCNNSCKKKYWRASRRQLIIKSCAWCQKEFEASRSDTFYCSKKCIGASARERKGIPVMGTFNITCRCGKVFIKDRGVRKYCSVECSLIGHRQKKAMWKAKAKLA